MNLYFKDWQGNMRSVAQISDTLSVSEARATALKEISKFCAERNFKVYYIRIWNTKQMGQPMTAFDFGSHSEFFYTDRIVLTAEEDCENDSNS